MSTPPPPPFPAPQARPSPAFVMPPGQRLVDWWPEPRPAANRRLVLGALAVGIAAAMVLPDVAHGIGSFAVLVAAAGVVAAADARLRTPRHLVAAVTCLLLLSTMVLLDAEWIVTLCLLASFGLGVVTLVDARTVAGIFASSLAVPLAGLRGMPWLGRSVAATRRLDSWLPAARTVVISLLLVAVFGLLFSSADAVFGSWTDAVIPELSIGSSGARLVVLVLAFGVTLATAYVALNPPHVDKLAPSPGKPVRGAFEWLVPVGLVIALFAVFVVAQATAMFGGHDYVRRTTGLSYADYVHQGFAQLTTATVLTLGVVAVAARKAARATRRDRVLLRVVLGLLCALTLVVVASALYRMALYTDAYGLTRMRLLVTVFEAWLGIVLVLVLVAGTRLRAAWVPRAALLTGAVSLLLLAAGNPDALIADANLDRFERTGRLDTVYLESLSTDAAPVLAERWGGHDSCRWRWGDEDRTGLSWNLSRSRAASLDCP